METHSGYANHNWLEILQMNVIVISGFSPDPEREKLVKKVGIKQSRYKKRRYKRKSV